MNKVLKQMKIMLDSIGEEIIKDSQEYDGIRFEQMIMDYREIFNLIINHTSIRVFRYNADDFHKREMIIPINDYVLKKKIELSYKCRTAIISSYLHALSNDFNECFGEFFTYKSFEFDFSVNFSETCFSSVRSF